jgi:hypothetical protein
MKLTLQLLNIFISFESTTQSDVVSRIYKAIPDSVGLLSWYFLTAVRVPSPLLFSPRVYNRLQYWTFRPLGVQTGEIDTVSGVEPVP